MGPFETLVENRLLGKARALVGKLLRPLSKTLANLSKAATGLDDVVQIWYAAQREAGQKIPTTPLMRKAQSLLLLAADVEQEIRSVPTLETYIAPRFDNRKGQINEAIPTTIGWTLSAIGGTPLILRGLVRLAYWLGMRRTYFALTRAYEVTSAINDGVVDALIPDRVSYLLYKKLWKKGYQVTPEVLGYEEYRKSEARDKTESVIYTVFLIYTAWQGLLSILHAGVSMLGAVEGATTVVTGVDFGKTIRKASSVVRKVR